jgi:prophage regulatory protein
VAAALDLQLESSGGTDAFSIKVVGIRRPRTNYASTMQHSLRASSGAADPARDTAGAPRVFARLPTVMQATGLGRSTIYRLIASGAFPAPVRLGPRAVGWRWSDLDQWSESRQGNAPISSNRAARWVKGGRSPAPANP